MFDGKKKSRSPQIETLIGKETEIHGNVTFRGGLHVDGLVKGSINAESDSGAVLTLGREGVIEGDVKVPTVNLDGQVIGDVYAAEGIDLAEHARVQGNIYYHRIEMAMGAEVNGQLIHAVQTGENTQDTGEERSADDS